MGTGWLAGAAGALLVVEGVRMICVRIAVAAPRFELELFSSINRPSGSLMGSLLTDSGGSASKLHASLSCSSLTGALTAKER